jgi:hypothetical protein
VAKEIVASAFTYCRKTRDSYQGMPSQAAEKLWFWVAQRFSAAVNGLESVKALAAEVAESGFSAACSGVP